MQPSDLLRLRHMRDAALHALQFLGERSREDLRSDLQLSYAIVRCLEIIGEAAAAVQPATKDRIPELPWRTIVATRNRLIHGYFNVDVDVIFDTLRNDIPGLLNSLETFLESEAEVENGD
jgi:uncharacterized protein with HEPN domain